MERRRRRVWARLSARGTRRREDAKGTAKGWGDGGGVCTVEDVFLEVVTSVTAAEGPGATIAERHSLVYGRIVIDHRREGDRCLTRTKSGRRSAVVAGQWKVSKGRPWDRPFFQLFWEMALCEKDHPRPTRRDWEGNRDRVRCVAF